MSIILPDGVEVSMFSVIETSVMPRGWKTSSMMVRVSRRERERRSSFQTTTADADPERQAARSCCRAGRLVFLPEYPASSKIRICWFIMAA